MYGANVPNEVIEVMVADGFTKKAIYHYFHYINAEKEEDFEKGYMQWAHDHGFVAQHALTLGINESNIQDFISDYDFYKTYPHNTWLRLWVNDKLTLRYIFYGTKWNNLLPEYYFYTLPQNTEGKNLRALVDNPYPDTDLAGFVRILKEKKVLACKPNNGTESVGFYKLSYNSEKDSFYINADETDEAGLADFLRTHPNYIFTEYITAGGTLAQIHKKIHTLRVTVINEDGKTPQIIGGFLRLPVDGQGEANHKLEGNANSFALYAAVNMETGEFGDFKALYTGRVEKLSRHPDTNFDLTKKYKIENWQEVVKASKEISCYLFGTEFIGFDYGITDKGLKIMEINTLPGNRGNQWSRDVCDNSVYVDYIRRKVREIDEMPEDEKRKRQNIV